MVSRFALMVLLSFTTAAAADPLFQGAYVSGAAGANFAGTMNASQGTGSIGTSVGPVGIAAVGLKWAYGFRTEIEGRYSANRFGAINVRRVNGLLEPLTNSSGTAATSAVMTNLVYDIPLQPFGLPIHPYLGAGVGYARLDVNATGGAPLVIQSPFIGAPPGASIETPGTVRFGAAGAFAYQAIAGVSVPFPSIPGVDVTLEYRFFGTGRENIPVTRTTNAPALQAFLPSPSLVQSFPQRDNEVLVGLRYTFGAPSL